MVEWKREIWRLSVARPSGNSTTMTPSSRASVSRVFLRAESPFVRRSTNTHPAQRAKRPKIGPEFDLRLRDEDTRHDRTEC